MCVCALPLSSSPPQQEQQNGGLGEPEGHFSAWKHIYTYTHLPAHYGSSAYIRARQANAAKRRPPTYLEKIIHIALSTGIKPQSHGPCSRLYKMGLCGVRLQSVIRFDA